jgi:tRNA wybutosine-synthesizing protein 1
MKLELKKLLEKQQYEVIGSHSGVKICTWTKKSLRDEDFCYKQKFYGIKSHRCCQMTPSIGFCQNNCIFCWREMDYQKDIDMEDFDDPKEVVSKSILAQRKLLSGFGGNEKVNLTKLEEAKNPNQFAISLSGEPTMYPKLNELIKEYNKIGTTFVVSNGLLPSVIEKLEMPTQLYISVDAPNKKLFEEIDKPMVPNAWEKLNRTMDVLDKIKDKTRTALRFTLIKGFNMVEPENWAKFISKSNALFVEVKAYMWVGSSRQRLDIENMPMHEEVKAFAQQIADNCGYKIIDEKPESRVVLLMKEDFDGRIMEF